MPPIIHRGWVGIPLVVPTPSVERRRSDHWGRPPRHAPTPGSNTQLYPIFYGTVCRLNKFVKRIYLLFNGLGQLTIRLPLYNPRVVQQLKHRKRDFAEYNILNKITINMSGNPTICFCNTIWMNHNQYMVTSTIFLNKPNSAKSVVIVIYSVSLGLYNDWQNTWSNIKEV